MGILNDVDITLDATDVIVNVINERTLPDLYDGTCVFESVPFDSCHFSILKRFDGRFNKKYKPTSKIIEGQLGKFDWACTNLLKYFGLSHIYKGATICIKQYVEPGETYWGARGSKHINTLIAIIFRGHNRKNDYAIMLRSLSTNTISYNVYLDHQKKCKYSLMSTFRTERDFNSIFAKLRQANKISNDTAHNWLKF